MRAFDWSLEWSDGERRHLMVVMAVLNAEKLSEGAVFEWWSVVGGWKVLWWKAVGSKAMKFGTLRR